MSKRLVIAGAGGFGRGVYGWVNQSPKHREEHDIGEVVFIDDNATASTAGGPVVSPIHAFQPSTRDLVLCAVGNPLVRKRITDELQKRGAIFHTFVDDRATVGSRVEIASGSIVCPGVVISADVRIAPHVHVNFNCSVGHDTRLGAFTTLSPSVNIMGEVVVGESTFFGGSSAVMPRLTVGASATIGAGAICVTDVRQGETVVGNPARPLYPEGVA